jgi:DNA-binding NarL/FixJ family response regulator
LRALCVGRHQFLSDHLGLFFRELGLDTDGAVGIDGAVVAARRAPPDVVVCDYDLLATAPLEEWERDEVLSRIPVVAVSLTRRPDEGHPLDVNGIAGFLYLPGLSGEEALAVVAAAAHRATYVLRSPFDWKRSTAPRG